MAISAQSACAVLIMVLSVEEHVFLVEHVFHERDEYSQAGKVQFLLFPDTPLTNRNSVCALIQKFRQTGSLDGARLEQGGHLNLQARKSSTFSL